MADEAKRGAEHTLCVEVATGVWLFLCHLGAFKVIIFPPNKLLGLFSCPKWFSSYY